MTHTNKQFLQELNVAIVDSLLSLSDYLNSGMISLCAEVDKEYDAFDTNIKIECKGGIEDNDMFINMNIIDLGGKGHYNLTSYSLDIRTSDSEDGGFGEVIRKEVNRLLNKERTVPDYAVEALNSGYSCLKASNP